MALGNNHTTRRSARDRGFLVSTRSRTVAEATIREVESQPATWATALAFPAAERELLPRTGESTLAIGCGTSYYVLDAYARRRQELGQGLTRAAVASELDDPTPYDRVLYLSRSGTTTDVLRTIERLQGASPSVAVCGVDGTPIANAVDQALILAFADEESVVQTRFATTALLLLRQSIGDDVADLPQQAATALTDALPTEPGLHDHFVFLGTGWTIGVAHEAALKCREAAALHTEAYPIGEYRHGPIAVAGERSLVWSFAPLPADVRDAISQTGARLVEAERDPLAELIRVHRLAIAIAGFKGLDPDTPPHLSRSVVNS